VNLREKKGNPINTFIVPFVFPDYIEGCVKSIWEHCDPEKHRLILIDNTEKGELYPKLQDRAHLYIRSYRNLGCSKSWNMGIHLSKTKYWSIMGDDTRIIHENWWPELQAHMEANDMKIGFCDPCHLTQPEKVRGNLEPPEFTEEMWEETKHNSGDMAGRFNCLVIRKDLYHTLAYQDEDGHFLLNEDLYPCYWVDRDFHFRMKELDIHKSGLKFPVWHMRAMTTQSGKMPLHDKGPTNPDVAECPKVRRCL